MQTEFPTQPSYRSQREQFLAAATTAGATLTEYPHPLTGPFGEAFEHRCGGPRRSRRQASADRA